MGFLFGAATAVGPNCRKDDRAPSHQPISSYAKSLKTIARSKSTDISSFILLSHECDGRLSNFYAFAKPNDQRALDLMNRAATHVVQSIPDITIAYGVSDEYSFVLHRRTALFERRKDKLVSTMVSSFTAAYVLGWNACFVNDEAGRELTLEMLPTFDGRAVCYPSWENLRDYLSWRQVDCRVSSPLPLFLRVGLATERGTNRRGQVTLTTCTIRHSGRWCTRAA
jgi:hypothetical protein